jgi:hypothetical protein
LHTALALARWRLGAPPPPDAAADGADGTARARWYAQLERALVAWLEEGGLEPPKVSLEKKSRAVRILTD